MTKMLGRAWRGMVLVVAAGGVAGAIVGATMPAIATPLPSVADASPALPIAHCGAGSLPETGLQGEVPLADQLDGRSQQGYRCNLELVGQFEGDGAAYMLAWYGHCAYMPTLYSATDPNFANRKGTVVLDVSNPSHPVMTERLQTPGMVNPWESLKANERSGLLASGEGGSFPLVGPGATGPIFDLYDVKQDCAHPRLESSVSLPHAHGHEGDFAPNGKTYYQGTLQSSPNATVVAIDVSDPKKPRELAAWPNPLGQVHAVQISDDGNRGYFMVAGFNGESIGNNGLVIADTSEIQARKPHPQIRIISHLFWKDGAEAQISRIVRIHGHPYVIATDEFGAQASPALACARGESPYGFVHIVDIADERDPKLVSTIRLQVNDPANCATVLPEQNAPLSLMYSSHYCTADDPRNTKAIACAWISSGIRVFDVRDPLHPREIAYYNPPARIDAANLRGSAPIFDALVGTRTKDATLTQVRWIRDTKTRQEHLWFISGENGFQVVKFTNGAYPMGAATPTGGMGNHTPQSHPVPAKHSSMGRLAATGWQTGIAALGLAALLVAVFTARLRNHARRSSP